MCGELGLANSGSSGWEIFAPQTLEYKGFGGENARDLPGAVILSLNHGAPTALTIPVNN
jgi:hypothetical protein